MEKNRPTLNQSNLRPPSLTHTQRENGEARHGRGPPSLCVCVESGSSQPNWLVLSCGEDAADLFTFILGDFRFTPMAQLGQLAAPRCVCVCLVVCKFQLPSEPSANCSPYKHIQQHVHALTTRKQSFYSARCVYKLFAVFSDVWAGCCSLCYSPACGAARLLDASLPTSAKLEPLIAIPFCGLESVCFLFPSCLALNVFKGPAFKLLRFLSFFFTAFHKVQFCNP